MDMFLWNDEFSVKIPLIDEQHKRLFEIGNAIGELLKESHEHDYFIEIMDQLDALIAYTKFHFDQEEKLMCHYHFPGLEYHIKEHKNFVDYLDKLDYHIINTKQEETLVDLISFITSWVIKHIMDTDFQYSDFLVEAMNKN